MPNIKNFLNCLHESEENFAADRQLIDRGDCIFPMKYFGSQDITIWCNLTYVKNAYRQHKIKAHKIKGILNISALGVKFTISNVEDSKQSPRVQKWSLDDIEFITEIGQRGLAMAVQSTHNTSFECLGFKTESTTAKRVKLAFEYAKSQTQKQRIQEIARNFNITPEERVRGMERSYLNTGKDEHENFHSSRAAFPFQNSARKVEDFKKETPFNSQFSMMLPVSQLFDFDSDGDI